LSSFISSIFKRKLVTQGILIGCLDKLLEQKLPSNRIDEEYLEVAFKMITQTGSLINLNQDHDAKISKCLFIVENVADGLIKDSTGKTIYSKRISFLAKDVIDLKNVR